MKTEGYFYSKYSQLRAAHSQLVSNVGSLQRQSERLLNENVVLEEHVKAQHGAFFKKQAAMERAQRQIAAERTCLVKEAELQERRKNWLAVQSERLRSRKVMERGAAGSILNGPGDVVQAEVAGADQMAKEQKLHPQDFVHGHLDNAKADRLERNRRRGVLKMSEDERKMRNLNSRMMRTAEKEHARLTSDRRRCFDEDNRGSKHGQRLEAQAQAQCTVSNELKVGYKAVRQRVLARENAKEAERRGVERMREKANDFRRLHTRPPAHTKRRVVQRSGKSPPRDASCSVQWGLNAHEQIEEAWGSARRKCRQEEHCKCMPIYKNMLLLSAEC